MFRSFACSKCVVESAVSTLLSLIGVELEVKLAPVFEPWGKFPRGGRVSFSGARAIQRALRNRLDTRAAESLASYLGELSVGARSD
jgi:hypothetical protein